MYQILNFGQVISRNQEKPRTNFKIDGFCYIVLFRKCLVLEK